MSAVLKPSAKSVPITWREAMPDPAMYYEQHLRGLAPPEADGWASCYCPFHDGRKVRAKVHITHRRGAFRCTQCEAMDLVSFEMRMRQIDFRTAVLGLIRFATEQLRSVT